MGPRYEFAFYASPGCEAANQDEQLGLLGSLGWEIRGIALAGDGTIVVALQRKLPDGAPLPDAPTLAAQLDIALATPEDMR